MRIKIFTDGACSENPGPGGWGTVFCFSDDVKILRGNSKSTTNNRMELTAVIKALHEILLYGEGEYEICSDSAYVINAIKNSWMYTWRVNDWKTAKGSDVKNRDLWERMIRLLDKLKSEEISVIFTKVKGHAGNTFNELVDSIAKEESSKAKLDE